MEEPKTKRQRCDGMASVEEDEEEDEEEAIEEVLTDEDLSDGDMGDCFSEGEADIVEEDIMFE